MVVSPIPVDMTRMHTIGPGSCKDFEDQRVDGTFGDVASFTERYGMVSGRTRLRLQDTPCATNSVTPTHPLHTFDTSTGTNLIISTISGYSFPPFVGTTGHSLLLRVETLKPFGVCS